MAKGRPKAIDPFDTKEGLERLKTMMSYGLNVEQVAGIFKMHRATMYTLMERNPQIKIYMDEGRAIGIAKIAQSLAQRAIDGDTTAAIFYLKAQAGWKDRTEVVHSGSITHELELAAVKRIDAMTPEQRTNRLEELKKLKASDTEVIDVEVD